MATLAVVNATCTVLERRGDDTARVMFQPDTGAVIELVLPAAVAGHLALYGRYTMSLADLPPEPTP